MAAPKLPKMVYVYMEDDGEGSYFTVANTEFEGIDSGTVVGIYELKETKTVTVTTVLQ